MAQVSPKRKLTRDPFQSLFPPLLYNGGLDPLPYFASDSLHFNLPFMFKHRRSSLLMGDLWASGL